MDGLGNKSSSSCGSFNGDDENNVSATLPDLEVLDCPVCTDALTIPILQCNNGHIACSSCCKKLKNKCPTCTLPIGYIRCRAMERVLKAAIVPCPKAKFGCKQKLSYGEQLTHDEECTFAICYCPARNCTYTGSYKDLYSHFKIHKGEIGYNYEFVFGEFREVYFELPKYTSVVTKERNDGLLFVVQCFIEPHLVYVTMSCISPTCLEVGEFSCYISTAVAKYNMTFDLPEVKRIRKLSSQTPVEDFMLVPTYFLHGRQTLKLWICVSKLNQNVTMDIYILCSSCYNKLRNKCLICAIPMGHIRCRAMERVIEAVVVPCPNTKFGCTKNVSYGKESNHEKECTFSCSCPAWNCNYTGFIKNLYSYFDIHKGERRNNYPFLFGQSVEIYFEDNASVVIKEYKDGFLFVVQRVSWSHGYCVTVSCIAHALEVGEFSCHISTMERYKTLKIEWPKVKKIQKLSFQAPKDQDFLLVPFYLLYRRPVLKLRICISKLNQL